MVSSKEKKHIVDPTTALNLVGYQDYTIVSRTLLNKQTGSITVFAFDAGQGLSEHTTPFDAFVFILDGEAEIIVSGKKHQMQMGAVLLLPAHKPHAVHAVKRFKMMLVMIQS